MEHHDTLIGYYTNFHDTICTTCGGGFGREDTEGYILREGYPDGFTCVECTYTIPCDPDACTCETATGEKYYTVTATATYFVTAKDSIDAHDIIYEALLGNDKKSVLSGGEIHSSGMVIERGTHYTISHGDKEPF